MRKKICFVIMGFGKKMDYENAREVDLDEIYNRIIKEAFLEDLCDYELIRADEIAGSSLIDIGMYGLLMKADLVIAELTTLNTNAIYELGIRHALKPYSTIIMMSEMNKIPFDLDHNRVLKYKDIGEVLEETEISDIKEQVKRFVRASEDETTDSPFYTFLPNVLPPHISEEEYSRIIKDAQEKEDSISSLVERAEEMKSKSQFKEASELWRELVDLLPANSYVVQQLALSIYKSKLPNETIALNNALIALSDLKPEKSLDIETLGISGAIYKRLYIINQNYDCLDEAIKYYKKGYVVQNDYYNGENYATCLLYKTQQEDLEQDEIDYLLYEGKKVCAEITQMLEDKVQSGDADHWIYATLANCFFRLGDRAKYKKYEEEFLSLCTAEWERDTYMSSLENIRQIMEDLE